MMGGGQPQTLIDPLTGTTLKPTQERVGLFPTAPAGGGRSSAKVLSHIADPSDIDMRTGQKPPLLRYPWEGVCNVYPKAPIPRGMMETF